MYNPRDAFAVVVYDRVGGHGNGPSSDSFGEAIKAAEKLAAKSKRDTDCWYVGVEPQGTVTCGPLEYFVALIRPLYLTHCGYHESADAHWWHAAQTAALDGRCLPNA